MSRTPGEISMPPSHPGQHTIEILADWGFTAARIDELIASLAVVAA
jgi:crotonobetainyl-CoA:carnitine CoA-transferase CaiB-like acyl-CoA transferase